MAGGVAQHVHEQGGVLSGAGNRPVHAQLPHVGERVAAGDPTAVGLQPDETARRGGDAHGAAAVRADRARQDPRRDRRGLAPGRSTGGAVQGERVACRWVHAVLGIAVEQELWHLRLAQDHGPGGLERSGELVGTLSAGQITVLVPRCEAAPGGGHPGDVVPVLERAGNPQQRGQGGQPSSGVRGGAGPASNCVGRALARGQPLVRGAGALPCRIPCHVDERPQMAVQRVDAVQCVRGECHAGRLTAAQRRHGLGQGGEVLHGILSLTVSGRWWIRPWASWREPRRWGSGGVAGCGARAARTRPVRRRPQGSSTPGCGSRRPRRA